MMWNNCRKEDFIIGRHISSIFIFISGGFGFWDKDQGPRNVLHTTSYTFLASLSVSIFAIGMVMRNVAKWECSSSHGKPSKQSCGPIIMQAHGYGVDGWCWIICLLSSESICRSVYRNGCYLLINEPRNRLLPTTATPMRTLSVPQFEGKKDDASRACSRYVDISPAGYQVHWTNSSLWKNQNQYIETQRTRAFIQEELIMAQTMGWKIKTS